MVPECRIVEDQETDKPLGQLLHDEFVRRFEEMHRALSKAETELANDPRSAASIHQRATIPERMTVEERHIWNMAQKEQMAYSRYRAGGRATPGARLGAGAAGRKRKGAPS